MARLRSHQASNESELVLMDAKNIISAAQALLQDDGTRWSVDELAGWINAGVREIAIHRPDVVSETVEHELVEGTRQTLPEAAVKLIEIVRNADGRPISLVKDRRMLDVSAPNWHRMPPASYVKHFIFDLRDTNVFYVYPPAQLGIKVDMVVAQLPPSVVSASNVVTQDEVGVPAIFQSALIDYVLYRAWTKDAEYAGNAALGSAHYQAFSLALAGDLQANVLAGPKKRGSATPESINPSS